MTVKEGRRSSEWFVVGLLPAQRAREKERLLGLTLKLFQYFSSALLRTEKEADTLARRWGRVG